MSGLIFFYLLIAAAFGVILIDIEQGVPKSERLGQFAMLLIALVWPLAVVLLAFSILLDQVFGDSVER